MSGEEEQGIATRTYVQQSLFHGISRDMSPEHKLHARTARSLQCARHFPAIAISMSQGCQPALCRVCVDAN